MADLNVIRNALAAQVQQYASPYLRMLPEPQDQINPPLGVVQDARNFIDYVTTLEGATGFLGGSPVADTNFNLDILLVVSKASTLERVEQNLYAWLGFTSTASSVSVPAAVLKDATLGGAVHWCLPTTAEAPGPIEWNGIACLSARIHFQLSAL